MKNNSIISNKYELVANSSTIQTTKTRPVAKQMFWHNDTKDVLETKRTSIVKWLEFLKLHDPYFNYNVNKENNRIMVKLHEKNVGFVWLNLNIYTTKKNKLVMFAENFEKGIHIDFKSILMAHMIMNDTIKTFPVLR